MHACTSPSLLAPILRGATINETIFREYLGASVEVNHLNITQIRTVPGYGTVISYNFYWNRATGMITEFFFYQLVKPEVGSSQWIKIQLQIVATGGGADSLFNRFDAGTWNGVTYIVKFLSNSNVSGFYFNPEKGSFLRFNVTGSSGTTGFCDIIIPGGLLLGELQLYKNGSLLVKGVDYTQTYNGTHYAFHITYSHSTHTIEIRGTQAIPEFPSFLIPPLLMIATLLVIIFSRKKTSHAIKG